MPPPTQEQKEAHEVKIQAESMKALHWKIDNLESRVSDLEKKIVQLEIKSQRP